MPMNRSSPEPAPGRLEPVDLARGLAIVQMIAYHFIYDLNHFGWIRVAMTVDPRCVAWRTAIVTQFLLIAGVGIGLGHARGRTDRRFRQRWLQVAGAAALVSAASAMMFGPRFIWFGILHFVALALLLARPLPRLREWNFALGAAALAAGLAVHDARFDPPALSWLGMAAHKPATEDYVPVLPWIGVVAAGIGLASLWQRAGLRLPSAFAGPHGPVARALLFLGRWPLTVYLLHQPILMGVLSAVRAAG
jgi:uncharacterized membrane protein